MWSQFKMYFHLGFEHIIALDAQDHIIFVVALMAIYQLKDWRRILILVTAFTLGHSITLAISGLGYFTGDPKIVETLIAFSILVAALVNLGQRLPRANQRASMQERFLRYGIAFCFGLVHGLGFARQFKSISGGISDLLFKLLAFNIGLEVGQIVIVLLILLLSFLFTRHLQKREHDWNVLLSGAALGISLFLILQRLIG
jgi:uncharacterized BrkB/YihY/UPF0761 family membrane protein